MGKKYFDTKDTTLESSILSVWQEAAKKNEDKLDPVNKDAVKKKFDDRKDKDIDNDGDVDSSDKFLHKRRKAISKSIANEGLEDSPNPANSQHLCAKNVVHEEWGAGQPVHGMHDTPDADGNIAWYDVMFEHGIEKGVSINELKVTKSESHHHGEKKKDDEDKEMLKAKKHYGEEVELDEAQKLFMFTTKAEAQKKAKEIGGKVLELKRAMDGNMFAVVTMDLTKEEVDLDEALSSKDQKAIEDYVSKFMSKMTPDLKAKMEKDPKAAAAVLAKMAMNTEDLDEAKMSASQIATLKKAYEPMRGKKISVSNSNKLSAMMDKVGKDKEALIQLFKADIPFVSQSAVTKLITKHNMKGAEINKLREEVGESYEIGTDEYRDHTLEVTPGQSLTWGSANAYKQASMKEALAKVWGLDEKALDKSSKEKYDEEDEELKPVKGSKTMTGGKVAKVEIQPKIDG
jgi:hypothetical protein